MLLFWFCYRLCYGRCYRFEVAPAADKTERVCYCFDYVTDFVTDVVTDSRWLRLQTRHREIKRDICGGLGVRAQFVIVLTLLQTLLRTLLQIRGGPGCRQHIERWKGDVCGGVGVRAQYVIVLTMLQTLLRTLLQIPGGSGCRQDIERSKEMFVVA